MKTLANSMMIAACCLLAIGSQAQGQDTKTQQQVQGKQSGNATRAGNLDDKTVGTSIRASQLIGMNIENKAGEGVGEISDLVIDARTGKVSYAAVTYGGFIGIGNKMHAVPMAAFKFMADPDDKDETILVLNVTQKQMEGETGFDESTWPNFADKSFQTETNRRYGVEMHHDNEGRSTYSSDKKKMDDKDHDKRSDK